MGGGGTLIHPTMEKQKTMSDITKAVLAYSGGLDTSVILKWLQDTYQCEVVTFTADLGQGEELEPARAKALKMGIKPENIFIDDLREEFVRDFVFPMFRANQMMAYLVMMAARLVELHRVLKPTGSLYLHCDPTASHYLKILLDTIFGMENFQN